MVARIGPFVATCFVTMALSELLNNPDLHNLVRNLHAASVPIGKDERKGEEAGCGHPEKLLVSGVCSCEIPATMVTLPCTHKATTTKCGESTNPSLIMCRVRCVGKARGCGHEVRTRCHSKDLLKQALAPLHQCQMLLPCGHRCSSSWCCKNKAYAVAIGKGSTEEHALKQADAVEHLPCTQMCDKRMPCGHRCERGCHYGRPCKCFGRGCIHAACSAAPCQGDCDWQCPHLAADEEGRQPCTMPCGLPCVRPPCDMQCEKVLPCGHRCPSLCGEPCPEVHNCPKCTGEEGDVIITGEIPLWLPCCGARVQLVELDDVFNMTTYYEQTSERNGYARLEARGVWSRFGAPKPLPYGHRPHIPECKLCGKPIFLINRYRRITALAALVGAIEQSLPAHNGCLKMLEDAYASLIKIEADIGLVHSETRSTDAAEGKHAATAENRGVSLATGEPPLHSADPPAAWLGGAAGDGVSSKPVPHSEEESKAKEREVYHPETATHLLLDLTADPMHSMLRVNSSSTSRDVFTFTFTSSQLAALRMVLRAVYTAYSFADASLQRSVQGSYTSLGGNASLGIPRFDLTLDIAACQLHLRLCTLLVVATPELPVDYLLSICGVGSKAVTRMTEVVQELDESDSLKAVELAGLDRDLPYHASSYHALVVCCAARVLKMLMGDPALRAKYGAELDSVRIELVQRLEESAQLVVFMRSTLTPALLDLTKFLRDMFAGEAHELIITVGAAKPRAGGIARYLEGRDASDGRGASEGREAKYGGPGDAKRYGGVESDHAQLIGAGAGTTGHQATVQ